jgi:hypothetical protein
MKRIGAKNERTRLMRSRFITTLVLLALGVACTPGSRAQGGFSNRGTDMNLAAEARDDQGTRQFITNTAQAQFGDSLRVGAGNIWDDEYVDEAGKQVKGLTGGLWFFVRDQSELDHHIRVHPGQRVEFGGYRIHVLVVEQDGIGISVLLPGQS